MSASEAGQQVSWDDAPAAAAARPDLVVSNACELLSTVAWTVSMRRLLSGLAAPGFDADVLAKQVSHDAALVVRILTLSASELFPTLKRPTSELSVAIKRLGPGGLRVALVATALARLRAAPRWSPWRSDLLQLGFGSSAVAAMTAHIARRLPGCDASDALLCGLVHNVGQLALLVESPVGADADRRARLAAMIKLYRPLGAAVARRWQLPESICAAIAEQHCLRAPQPGSVLAAALVAVRGLGAPASTAAHLVERSDLPFAIEEWQALLQEFPRVEAAARVVLCD